MSGGRNALAAADADLDKTVADYLRRHPAFFDAHPELLAELRVPHASGKAVSLVERQVAVLRDQNRALRTKLDELIAIARDNERLSRRLHTVTLALMRAASPGAAVEAIERALREDFRADRVLLRVFADAATAESASLPAFAGAAAPERTLFATTVETRRPTCGRLGRVQHEALFGEGGEIGSAVILPLGDERWRGLLVIASRDARRYRADYGIELLTHLAEVASLALDRWVRAP